MTGLVIWITGVPGSGKSAISDAVMNELPEFVVLRMDEMRKVVTPAPTYSDIEREIVYRSIIYAALRLSNLGHNVIIDATGNMRRWRDTARGIMPRYAEIYLKCGLNAAIEREKSRPDTHGAPVSVYDKAREGWPVPGVTAPYEEPIAPELVIDTEALTLKESLDKAINFLKDLVYEV